MNAKHTSQLTLLAEPTPGKKSMSLRISDMNSYINTIIYITNIIKTLTHIYIPFRISVHLLLFSSSDILFFWGRDLFLN